MTKHRLPWNHNNHYHAFLLTHVPNECEVALDIGCGVGEFASRLAQVCKTVEAIDPDRQAIDCARTLWNAYPNVRWHAHPFEGNSWTAAGYGFVSAIASLHHVELAPMVAHMKRLLKPGGVLAILGLYKETTISDLLYSAAAIPVNFIIWKNSTNV